MEDFKIDNEFKNKEKNYDNFELKGLIIWLLVYIFLSVFLTIVLLAIPDMIVIENGETIITTKAALYLNFFLNLGLTMCLLIVFRKYLGSQVKLFFSKFGKNIALVFTGVIFLFIVTIVAGILIESLGVSDTSENQEAIEDMFNISTGHTILIVIFTAFFAPFIEEFIFRGCILGGIERFGNVFNQKELFAVIGIIVSSLIFGLMHVVSEPTLSLFFINLIPYTALGVALGFIYIVSGKNLICVILIHGIYNFIISLMMVMM